MIEKSLYDISELSEIDTDIENIIITESEIVKSSLSEELEVKKAFSKIFRENLDKKFKTGDIVLVCNDDVSIKAYCLVTIICGEIVPYVISYVDYNDGVEINNNFSMGDLEMLSAYPELSDKSELIFFITKLSRIFSESASSSYRKFIFGVKECLDKGLWVAKTNSIRHKDWEVGNKSYSADFDYSYVAKEIMDKMNIPSINEENTIFESEGKLITFYDGNIYGPYNLVRKVYCEIASVEGNEGLIYDNSFGELFTTEAGASIISKNLIEYENEVKKFNTPKAIEKSEKQVVGEILNNINKDIVAGENDFLAFMDEVVEKEKETVKSTRKKKNVENFSPKSEISQQEKELAIKETIMKQVPTIDVVSKSQSITLNNSVKSKNAILNNPTDSYPIDWDYVYSVGETSRMYNPTVGQKYDEKSNSFIADDTQTKGMTIEDWNAYFIAHPELSHLIEQTIGHLGGLFMTEENLIKSGHLLYDAKRLKLAYKHEYIKGNVYKLIEDLEVIKDSLIQIHGKEFYDNQMEVLLKARPEVKKITSADPKMVPFIHPLDEVVLEYTTNQAAGITYINSVNPRLMKAEAKRLEEDVKAKILNPGEVPSMMEDYGARLQSLPITSFFMDWLSNQYGKIAEYGLPDIEMVKGLSLDFLGMSHTAYADELEMRGLIKVPQDKKAIDIVSSSDYFEAKDSAKRFVNELFQEFLVNEISDSDREQIEYLWNKRYNGYANPDIWKLPVFFRHSKYFKNRTNKRFLKLSETQIMAIKFATIENSSIMALEVGYGKTLVAIAYMSHCFETAQASNFLITVPKTLFVNKKWREEIYGVYDEAKNKYIIGATPNYNLIEIGNASTTEIFGGGDSKYKNYADNEEMTIKELLRIFVEIGGRQAGGRTATSKGTATIPTNAYNYKLAVSTSNYAWSKLINIILPEIDLPLFNRCIGTDSAKNKAILDVLTNFNLGTSAKDKAKNIIILAGKLISTNWYYERHLPLFGPDVEFTGSLSYDDNLRKEYVNYEASEMPGKFKKDKNGKVMYDKDGKKIPLPWTASAQEYVLENLAAIHRWIEKILQRMSDFAIYEYGTWKFETGNQNVILATKEALANLGFSNSSLEGVRNIVEEITTYKNEENFDTRKSSSVTIFDLNGEKQVFNRNPQKVLQKQLKELMDRINVSMTEEGPRGKFFLENLKIDGFILDEAHIAKKIFTNVKTDASVFLPSPTGNDSIRIKTTSHDIKGGKAPDISLSVFGICQYIRSLGHKKPLMLLTATPFSNQPTEIFSMLSLVGINQLRDYGISNIKNFFDLFLKETLKYDFNQNGEFIKRITVEDFRNKELLMNLIWSVMDIRREASGENDKIKVFGDKPSKKVLPKLVSDNAIINIENQDNEDLVLSECEALGNVSTIAVLNRMSTNTCSIVDQNSTQKKMMEDIEKVATKQVNPKTLLNYTFEDFCPNISIFNEIEKADDEEKGKKSQKTEEDESSDNIVVALRTILNSNVAKLPGAHNFENIVELKQYKATPNFMNDKVNTLYFLKSGNSNIWEIYRKTIVRNVADMVFVSNENMATDTISALSKKMDYGTTFKALGISKAIALSPYLYKCNDLPEPTPENIIKFSPKIEYLVKAIKSVRDHHLFEIPKKIEQIKKELIVLQDKKNKTNEDVEAIKNYVNLIPQLEAAREVSGQVVYMNMIRFNYYERDSSGKAVVRKMNLANLIIQYIVDKGWFTKDEVRLISSDNDKEKEQYIREFQEGKIKVLFGTPAIKEGVDLQNKATTMYIMTPDWNPTDMRQVEGRIWRRDNENRYIRIVYVLLDQSVEIFIYSKLEEKSARLKQVMQERGTKGIEALEEMSLNPNETKVALASDPTRRADIVTKLCGAILEDQRNKINKNREELRQVSGTIEKVYENLEIAKEKYLFPYLQEMPIINAKYYDFLAKQVVEIYATNKKLFLSRFAQNMESNIYSPNKKSNDPIFNKALILLTKNMSNETQLYPIWNWNIQETYDLINGIDVLIDNRDKFIEEINNGGNSITLLNEMSPLRHSTDTQRVDGYLYCDEEISKYNVIDMWKMFTGPSILYRMTDDMLEELSVVIKAIKKGMDSQNITRQQMKDLLEGVLVAFADEYNEYALKHPHLKPENYGQYIYYRDKQNTSVKAITPFEFDSMDLPTKIEQVRALFVEIKEAWGSFSSFGVNTQRDLIAGKNKIPYQSEIIVKLDMASDKREVMNETFSEFNAIFQPILRIDYTLKEIQRTLFKTRGMSMDDLPALLETFELEYQAISDKIISLEASRLKLITRFEKLNKERESITIDDIVAEFAKTNNLLNYKLQEVR
jgi:superfamily II DNA or RNA helicase